MWHTFKEILCSEITGRQPENGEFVQFLDHIMWERKQLGKVIQLNVEAVAMTFGRIKGTLEAVKK